MLAQIKGMQALLLEKPKEFKALMKNAVSIEQNTDFPAGPPRITKPSFEQYGEWLLKNGNYKEALTQFNTSLSRMPKRLKSLQGKLTALQKLNENTKAKEVQEELNSILAFVQH